MRDGRIDRRDLARQPCHAPDGGRCTTLDLLLDGLALFITDGPSAAAETLQRAAKASTGIPLEDILRWGWIATYASSLIWDSDSFEAIAARHVQLVRDAGVVAQLPLHLWQLALLSTWMGDFAEPHRALHVVAAAGPAGPGS